jgi:hypothetical protein
MPVMYEGKWTGEFVLSEASRMRSRDHALIAKSTLLEPCTVLGRITESGKYKQLDPSAKDGTEKAAAILLAEADAREEDADCVVFARACEVKGPTLTWPEGFDEQAKTFHSSELAAKGIVVR